jgi:hypothetical protein
MSIEALASGYKIGLMNINLAFGFKRAIGDSGLTKSLFKMSFSYLKACMTIIIERPILFFTILPFIIFELLKFPIRYIRVRLC